MKNTVKEVQDARSLAQEYSRICKEEEEKKVYYVESFENWIYGNLKQDDVIEDVVDEFIAECDDEDKNFLNRNWIILSSAFYTELERIS